MDNDLGNWAKLVPAQVFQYMMLQCKNAKSLKHKEKKISLKRNIMESMVVFPQISLYVSSLRKASN